ncbi:MAG: pantoate--beta-alanine ligase [Pseudomonadota bacterium]
MRDLTALRSQVAAWRAAGERIALVPTMGALHEGHLSLIDVARAHADRVICSLFVNPKQFAAHEDLGTYPRQEAADLEMMHARGADLAWVPAVDLMYPEGFQTAVEVTHVSRGLCGDSRPHFFSGVAVVVLKLFNQVAPDVAVFGEKDFQQLRVIQRFTRDLDLPITVIGGPIVRAEDGLALSSRNAYLTEEERDLAPALSATLFEVAGSIAAGSFNADVVTAAVARLERAGFAVDYLQVRDTEALAQVVFPEVGKSRVLAAATLGKTRLIDNVPA